MRRPSRLRAFLRLAWPCGLLALSILGACTSDTSTNGAEDSDSAVVDTDDTASTTTDTSESCEYPVLQPWIDGITNWLVDLQFTDEELSSFGAFPIHTDPGHIGTDGESYLRVVPYSTSLALVGLIHASPAAGLQVAEHWIEWYLDHLDMSTEPPGVVLDHWYLSDGTGQTTCPPGISDAYCDHVDAADSVAATFIGLVDAWVWTGGDSSKLLDRATELQTVAEVMTALQDSDGLTWARDDHRVKYAMDNSEVRWALEAMIRLAPLLGLSSDTWEASLVALDAGLETELYDTETGLYRWAKNENGAVEVSDLNVWYPGVTAQAWPILFGAIEPESDRAAALMSAILDAWDGDPNPDWTSSTVDSTGFTWPSISRTAVLAGRCDEAWEHAHWVVQQKLPDFEHPWTADDAGFLLTTLTDLAE